VAKDVDVHIILKGEE